MAEIPASTAPPSMPLPELPSKTDKAKEDGKMIDKVDDKIASILTGLSTDFVQKMTIDNAEENKLVDNPDAEEPKQSVDKAIRVLGITHDQLRNSIVSNPRDSMINNSKQSDSGGFSLSNVVRDLKKSAELLMQKKSVHKPSSGSNADFEESGSRPSVLGSEHSSNSLGSKDSNNSTAHLATDKFRLNHILALKGSAISNSLTSLRNIASPRLESKRKHELEKTAGDETSRKSTHKGPSVLDGDSKIHVGSDGSLRSLFKGTHKNGDMASAHRLNSYLSNSGSLLNDDASKKSSFSKLFATKSSRPSEFLNVTVQMIMKGQYLIQGYLTDQKDHLFYQVLIAGLMLRFNTNDDNDHVIDTIQISTDTVVQETETDRKPTLKLTNGSKVWQIVFPNTSTMKEWNAAITRAIRLDTLNASSKQTRASQSTRESAASINSDKVTNSTELSQL